MWLEGTLNVVCPVGNFEDTVSVWRELECCLSGENLNVVCWRQLWMLFDFSASTSSSGVFNLVVFMIISVWSVEVIVSVWSKLIFLSILQWGQYSWWCLSDLVFGAWHWWKKSHKSVFSVNSATTCFSVSRQSEAFPGLSMFVIGLKKNISLFFCELSYYIPLGFMP